MAEGAPDYKLWLFFFFKLPVGYVLFVIFLSALCVLVSLIVILVHHG